MKYVKNNILYLIFILLCNSLFSQTIIKGNVKSDKGKNIDNVNVLILEKNNLLISFGVTDKNGNYKIEVNSKSDSLFIEISSINYKKVIKSIPNKSNTLNFVLEEDVKVLEEFKVIASPIEHKKDTVTYFISSFATEDDRSLKDVLKKVPGIDVNYDGSISYQGTKIDKFYVEGIDTEGRYKTITDNLSYKKISKVDIYENHQPIKIFENKIYSNTPSLNISLKDKITYSGNAELGIGLMPLLWKVNISPMIFSKNKLTTFSYKANNIGENLKRSINFFDANTLFLTSNKANQLNITRAKNPNFSSNKYLQNNSHYFELEHTIKLPKDKQINFNFYYLNDFTKNESSTIREIKTPTQSIKFSEKINNTYNNNFFKGGIVFTKNSDKLFFKNNLSFVSETNNNNSNINLNNTSNIYEKIKDPYWGIINKLSTSFYIKDQLIEFYSTLATTNSNQNLSINPGQFIGLLNDSVSFSDMYQNVNLRNYYNDNNFKINFFINDFIIKTSLGVNFGYNLFNSKLSIEDNKTPINLNPSFTNDIKFKNINPYLNLSIGYNTNKLKINFNVPLKVSFVNIFDVRLNTTNKKNLFLYSPGFYIKYTPNIYWELYTNMSLNNSLENFNNYYSGFILNNYKRLSNKTTDINTYKNYSIYAKIKYDNPFNFFLGILNYYYVSNHKNFIYSNDILDNGLTVLKVLDIKNFFNTHNFGLSLSKYFSKIKSTIKIDSKVILSTSKSFTNNNLFKTNNINIIITPSINIFATTWLNIDYKCKLNTILVSLENKETNKMFLINNQLNAFATILKDHTIGVLSEHYNYKDENFFFVDLLYRYNLKKHNIDIEANWYNILNYKQFTNYNVSANIIEESTYYIRPSQFLITIRFML